MTAEDQPVTHEGLGPAVGRCLGLLYAYDGVVVSKDTEWLQGALNVLINLLWRYRLVANCENSKAMTCQTVTLRSGMSEEVVERRCTGRGGNIMQATKNTNNLP